MQKPEMKTQGQKAENIAMQGWRAVIGEVVDTRDIQMKGVDTKHQLVKIKDKEGKTWW